MKKKQDKHDELKDYYSSINILDEISNEEVDLTLEGNLQQEILSGKRKRKLQNVTIKIDPLQIIAIKKLSNMKSIPYQTLIRHWLAEGIKHEMDSVQR